MLGPVVCTDDDHRSRGHDGKTGPGDFPDMHGCSEQRRLQGSNRPVSRQVMDVG